MNTLQSHDVQSSEAMPQHLAGAGLQRKLLRSHLTVVALGVALLAVTLISTLWLRTHVRRMETQRWSTVQAATGALLGVQRSLAGLRGWVALGDNRFRDSRMRAWAEQIHPAVATLKTLQPHATNPKDHSRVSMCVRLLRQLEVSQWWVEEVAHAPGNEPARVMLSQDVQPVAQVILSVITAMIDIEKQYAGSTDRKLLLGRMADFRGFFATSETLLTDFVVNADVEAEKRFRRHLTLVWARLKDIEALSHVLTSEQ
ncbi:MAG: hypothetical protein OEU26_28150, partial [Candidatus Tectomicrobia bacterium]|nr:hypothetical protein [Candidatus Tectomicrobia bacterium]